VYGDAFAVSFCTGYTRTNFQWCSVMRIFPTSAAFAIALLTCSASSNSVAGGKSAPTPEERHFSVVANGCYAAYLVVADQLASRFKHWPDESKAIDGDKLSKLREKVYDFSRGALLYKAAATTSKVPFEAVQAEVLQFSARVRADLNGRDATTCRLGLGPLESILSDNLSPGKMMEFEGLASEMAETLLAPQ
jgi:hypothetical protein